MTKRTILLAAIGIAAAACDGSGGTSTSTTGTGGGTSSTTTSTTGGAASPISAPAGIPTSWTAIAAGLNHTCAVGSNGTLWCWGRNASGQLGDGTTSNRVDPKQVLPMGAADWVDVTASGDFTCALRATGTLYCWGLNTSGQIGEGDTTSPVSTPVAIGAGNWAAISAGQTHTCAVAKDGTLWCWGVNTSGQLGLGNTMSPLPAPTKVGTDTDWARPLLGQGTSTCALKTSGDLYCWGSGYYGQLGMGSLAGFTSPQKVPSVTTWKTASLGNEHACGVGGDGRLLCWGASYGAQLGSGVPIVSVPGVVVDPQ